MNVLLKKSSSTGKEFLYKICKDLIFIAFLWPGYTCCQIGNYVNNGGFEEMYDCNLPNPIWKAKAWLGIDSITTPPFIFSSCPGFGNVPLNSFTYQLPKSGNNYITTVFFCSSCGIDNNRSYVRNRMKNHLQQGKIYCVKFHINITNNSTCGLDSYGAYFGDNSLDTITKSKVQLVYLTPQVQNPANNMLMDTLGWVPFTGTFVASGTEKYMVIGNFKSDAATNTVLINPTNLPTMFSDVCIDDVSCIEMNLPAYAGRDTIVYPGSNVFIGREPDFATDPGCVWYKLPNMATAIATVSGLWVNPTSTSTYVVKQVLDCSAEKWDTVVVKTDIHVGNGELEMLNVEWELFPNPAQDFLELKSSDQKQFENYNRILILNQFGQQIREEEFHAKIKTDDLPNGVYTLQLKSYTLRTASRRFVISR